MKLSKAIEEQDLSLAGVASAGTRALYRRMLRSLLDFIGDVEIDEITTSDLRRWRASLIERDARWVNHRNRRSKPGGLSPWTIRCHVKTARRFFSWLLAEGRLEHNPGARFELPPRPEEPPKAVSSTDLLRLMDAAHDNPRDYAIVCMLADTAARVGAIADLRVQDLDLDNHRALVHEKGRGGRRRARYVYFVERTAGALARYLDVRGDTDCDVLFLSRTGCGLTPGGFHKLLKRLADKADIEGRFNPHAFRHGWARGALDNQADLATVANVLGHSDVKVTEEFYARWKQDELQERHDRFTWIPSD